MSLCILHFIEILEQGYTTENAHRRNKQTGHNKNSTSLHQNLNKGRDNTHICPYKTCTVHEPPSGGSYTATLA